MMEAASRWEFIAIRLEAIARGAVLKPLRVWPGGPVATGAERDANSVSTCVIS